MQSLLFFVRPIWFLSKEDYVGIKLNDSKIALYTVKFKVHCVTDAIYTINFISKEGT